MQELRCPVCESRVRPDTRRPGILPRSMKFNQTVGCDLFEFDEFGYKVFILTMICWDTGYEQACGVPDRTSASVAKAFATHWHKHYGMPELLITDQGPEFVGKEFTSYVADHACLHNFIDSQSPWQQGQTESAGGSLKKTYVKSFRRAVSSARKTSTLRSPKLLRLVTHVRIHQVSQHINESLVQR